MSNEGKLKVTVPCRSQAAAESVAERLSGFSSQFANVVVEVVGNVVYMVFTAVRRDALTILGRVRDYLGASYQPSIAPA